MTGPRRLRRGLETLAALVLVAGAWQGLRAQLPPLGRSEIAARSFRHPDLFIANRYRSVEQLPAPARQAATARLAALGVPPGRAFLDLRGGRWGTLMLAAPLIPGTGVGNHLSWAGLGRKRPDAAVVGDAAWQALLGYLEAHESALAIDPDELARLARITVHDDGALIQIHAGRDFAGLAVRDSSLSAVISHGNLILLGTHNWGDLAISARPGILAAGAHAVLRAHLAPHTPAGLRRSPRLAIVPTAVGADPERAVGGRGYDYRLVWVIQPWFEGDPGHWEAMVDAHSGELLSFRDTNLYASARKVVGGVYPFTNDPMAPNGGEESSYPMAFTDVTHGGGALFSDGGGNLPICVEGDITTSLAGRYVTVTELCGPLSETSAGDLDLGVSGGTDCVTPTGASLGNTHSARTAFYELNRMRRIARGQLPGNGWLESQLPALTNFPSALLSCNAFWDGSGVIFFGSDPSLPPTGCSNTGELVGVVDHEWGHGLDDNDSNGLISNPAEGIADVFAALALNDSCIGRGFFKGTNCDPGDGDPCIACDGVRDVDWAQRQSGNPHDIAFIDGQCPAIFLGDPGPCGGPIHCEGAVVSEAVWDLLYRDLAPVAGELDLWALEVVTRLFYLGSGMVGNWFQCTPGAGTGDGCNADGGYLNLLAADDDDGDLGNGTPHMEAIFAAFDRHGIACAAPAVQNGGCSGAPLAAPSVTATALDRGAELSWAAVDGAEKYSIFRAEGVVGCAVGKAKIAETSGIGYVDSGLLNGFDYSYVVIPVGAQPSCLGPASACVAVTPVPGASVSLDGASAALNVLDGDLDGAIDNCETAELTFDLHNLGAGALSNVSLLDVSVLSHPTTVAITSPLPVAVAASLDPCEVAQAGFQFTAQGLAFNDVLEFRVTYGADELAVARSETLRLTAVELDLESHASKTFSFESGLGGWQVIVGTFALTAGAGAQSSAAYLASSAFLANQCDQIRSPLLRLSPSSTLNLWTSFDIEGPFVLDEFIFWFDRANLGLFNPVTGLRTPVNPDGGRLYNAGGSDGACVSANQEGWADSMPTWAESTWSSSALGPAAASGDAVQIDIGYGTDPSIEGAGFWFDEVTLTDFELVVPDGQSDICSFGNTDPVAMADEATPQAPGPVTLAVLDNDSDADAGDTLRILTLTQPSQGTAVINVVGPDQDTITYTASGCFVGIDTFDYQVTDGRGGTAVATVTVDLTALATHLGNDLDLSGQIVVTNELFQACNSISAGTGFEVQEPGDVVFRAGTVILLTNGFSVGPSARFSAAIDPTVPQ